MSAPQADAVARTHRRRAARLERDALPHLQRLCTLALLMTGDSSDAEDLVAETITAYASFQPQAGADPKARLYRILLTTYRCRPRPEPSPLAADPADRPHADAEPHAGSGLGRVQTEALYRLPDTDIKHALRQLPDDVQIMVYLADVEGYTYTEIADIVETPTSAVTARLHQGRRELRDRLLQYATNTLVTHEQTQPPIGQLSQLLQPMHPQPMRHWECHDA